MEGDFSVSYKSWNKIQLTKHLKQAEKSSDLIDAGIIKQLICDSIIPFDSTITPDDNKYNLALLKEYSYFLKPIEDLSKVKKIQEEELSLINIPIDSQLDFLYDFFSTVTPDWMDIFNKIYRERKKNLKINCSGNYSVYLGSIDYSYISINRNMSIDDLFNLVHEYTHTIVDRIKYRLSYMSHYPFIELPSITMEFISALLMKAFYLDIDNEVDAYLIELLNIVISYAKNIIERRDNLEENKNSNDYFYKQSLIHDLSYVIPLMYVSQLFYLYLSDKEKWMYTLNQIITMENSNNYLEDMKKLGLNPNQDLNRFIGDLDNHLKF